MSEKSIWVTYSPSVIDPNGELFAVVQFLVGASTRNTVKIWAEPWVAEQLVEEAIEALNVAYGPVDYIVRTPEERAARAECMVRSLS